MRLIRVLLVALALACAVRSPSGAADIADTSAEAIHPFFRHTFLFQGGLAFNMIQSMAAVGTDTGIHGTRIDFEDHLGLESRKLSFDALARWRLSNRWVLEAEFTAIQRSNQSTTDRSIDFGRLTFPASTSLSSDIDVATLRLATGYTFYKTSDTEVGAALSLYYNRIRTSLAGNATIGGLAAGFQTETFTVPAPLPTIGLYGHFALSPRWLLSGRVDYIDLNISSFQAFGLDLTDLHGRILNLEASAEYRFHENFGVGVGYRYYDLKLGATKSPLQGDLGFTTSTPSIFVRASY